MKINFTELTATKTKLDNVIVFTVGEDKKLSPLAAAINKQSGGVIAKALASGKFSGKRGQYAVIIPSDGVKCDRIILAGTGDAKKLTHDCAPCSFSSNVFTSS